MDRTAALARTVVARLAPEELPAFEMLAAPYLTGVDTSTDGGRLEFGVLDAVVTVTPVVTLVCATVTGALLYAVGTFLGQALAVVVLAVAAALAARTLVGWRRGRRPAGAPRPRQRKRTYQLADEVG
ncbi:hypothetical protein [Micromonospora sp. IBSANI012]|uniref:hypothetical protein n=1 Tax=Micromonospora sp. IBSANI012 TaxID=3457761 RepID=UPI004059ACAA